MQGTYWLTVLPETSQLRPRIKRALAGIDDEARIHPTVDDRQAEASGRRFGGKFRRGFDASGAATPKVDDRQAELAGRSFGSKFRKGFESSVSNLGAGARLIGAGFTGAADATRSVVRNIGTAATVLSVATKATKRLAWWLGGAATGLKVVAGASLAKVAGMLGFTAQMAGRLAANVTRVTSAILLLSAVGKVLGFMNRASKMMALLTVGSAALIGVVSALASQLGGALVAALTVVGSAAGVAAGALVGLLGPAIGTAKLAFKGLGEGAKAFQESMKDIWGPADEAFNKMIGQRMGPLLTQFRELKMAVTDAFSGALMPGMNSATGLMQKMQPAMTAMATTLGKIGSEVAGAIASPANIAALDKMFAASNQFVGSLSPGLQSLVSGLIQFASTAADTFKGVGAGISEQLTKFGEWLRGISPAQMILAFQALKLMVTNVWNVLKPVIQGIRDIGAVSAPALAPGFQAIGQAIGQAVPGLVQMAHILMPALSSVMERLAPLLPALVQAFTPWAGALTVIAPPLASIVAQMAPLAPLVMAGAAAVKLFGAAMIVGNTAAAAYSIGLGVFAAATGRSATSLGANVIALGAHRVAMIAGTVASRAFGVALAFATGPIGLIVAAVVAAGVAIWAFFTKTDTGRALWEKIWNGIKTTAKVVADWFMNTAVPALKSAWEAIAAGAMWLWNNAIVPAFEGIKSAISTAWEVIGPMWELFKAGIELVGAAIGWWWKNVTVPAFEAVKGAIQKFWTYAEPVWDGLTKSFDKVTTSLTPFKDAFVTVFDKIKEIAKGAWDAVGWIFEKIGGGITKVTDAVKGVTGWIRGDSPPGHADGKPAGFASGRPATLSRSGRLSGPGTGTSDSILAMLSNDEGVVKASAMNAGGGMGAVLVAALNSGWVPSAEFLHGMLPGYAEGLNPGADWLRTTIMQQWPKITTIGGRRSEDGYGEHSSGNAIDVMIPGYNTADGKALGDQVASWVTKNKDALGADGMIWRQTSFGYGGDWTNGKAMADRGSDTQNHMDHLHIILGKGRGAGAPSVDKPSSSISLPGGGASSGGSASSLGASTSASGGGSYRQATSGELANSAGRLDAAKNGVTIADQAVAERTAARDKAQRELDDLKAQGKDTTAAQRELDDANTELKDATDRQAKARDKAAKAEQDDAALRSQGVQDAYATGGGSSGGAFGDLGKSLWGGLMETVGLDGSVFSNPFEWPTVKSVMAGVNVLGSALMGGKPGSATGPGGAGDIGGVLGGIAGATGLDVANLNPAAADVTAAPASAVAPDTTQHGAGAGAAPGPAVYIENAGMSPTDVSNRLTQDFNARTRTTKVH